MSMTAIAGELAQAFGLDDQQARAVVDQVVPEMTHDLERLTLSRGGLADLIQQLGNTSNSEYAQKPDLLRDNKAREAGDQILDYVFGSKYRSRVIAQRAARDSELDLGDVKRMLPAIASLLMGNLGRETQKQIMGVADELRGDDRSFEGHRPLSVPGDDIEGPSGKSGGSPYGDLSDILRRGGRNIQLPQGQGGSLGNIIRDIIGGALGFRSKSIVGFILQLLLYRYGWRILSWIFNRLILGRR